MTATLAVSPASQTVNGLVNVVGTGGGNYKNRLKLDGAIVATDCRGAAIAEIIPVGSVAATQTFDWEQQIAGVWTSVDTQTIVVTAAGGGGGAVTPFPGAGPNTAAAFLAMLQNTTIEVIEIAAGTYTGWHVYDRFTRSAAHPLLVRPAAGAAVVWDNTGGGSGANGLFYFGALPGLPGSPTSVTDYITFDPAGTGGSFTIQNYAIGSFGLILTGWVDHVVFNGFNVVNCSGDASQNQSHCLYINSDNAHHGSNITANNWNVTGDTARTLNGVQTYHQPQVNGLTLHTWTVTKLHRWAYLWTDGGTPVGPDPTGIDLDGWNGTNCDATIDSHITQVATGTVKNCNAHGSCGPLALGSGFWANTGITNGGGNSA